MKKFAWLSFLFLSFLTLQSFAGYSIIIDADSQGSSLHLYEYQENKALPDIREIFNVHTQTSLASFIKNPAAAGESLKILLDEVTKKLTEDHITQTIPLRVFGTDTMRLLSSEEQAVIYTSVKKYLKEHYPHLIPTEEKTISGKMEGLYHWLDINYLTGHFANKTPTAGSVGIDSTTAHIAFATQKLTNPIDEMAVHINGTRYIVFSKSFLGLGLQDTRERINQNPLAASCYPQDAPFNEKKSGKFNLVNCRSLYRDLIESFNVEKHVAATYRVPSFIAKQGFYDTYHFFDVNPHKKDQETMEQKIMNPLCGNSWAILKSAFPHEDETALINYCANGIYLTDLLFSAYQIQGNQLTVLAAINNQNIEWTRGAMLYLLTQSQQAKVGT